MRNILVDSNIILDIFLNDQNWNVWSESILSQYSTTHKLSINPIIYTEISIGFERIEDLELAVNTCGFKILQMPKEALFLAGKAYIKYKKRKGTKNSTMPDFFIGAHAAISNMDLITRDVSRYRTYFPSVKLITPTLS
jgi:predicted nucleic acid-binding protein